MGSFLGILFPRRSECGGRFHVEELGVQSPSAHPQPLWAFLGGGFWCERAWGGGEGGVVWSRGPGSQDLMCSVTASQEGLGLCRRCLPRRHFRQCPPT